MYKMRALKIMCQLTSVNYFDKSSLRLTKNSFQVLMTKIVNLGPERIEFLWFEITEFRRC